MCSLFIPDNPCHNFDLLALFTVHTLSHHGVCTVCTRNCTVFDDVRVLLRDLFPV